MDRLEGIAPGLGQATDFQTRKQGNRVWSQGNQVWVGPKILKQGKTGTHSGQDEPDTLGLGTIHTFRKSE